MPDINNSLALQVNPNPINLNQTLGTISSLQQAQALIGLRDIQTQQAQRQYNALQAAAEAYRGKSDPVGAYLSAGGDPTGASTLQNVYAGQRAMAVTPGGLLPDAYSHLTSAGKNIAETQKVGVDTASAGSDFGAKIAQGVLADPSNDAVWRNAVEQHYKTFGGPELEKQQLLGLKDPAKRLDIAKAYAAQGVPSGTFGAPHGIGPTESVTTPGASYAVPQGAPVSTNRPGGALPSSPRMMGDDEAVRQGLYSPTPEQIKRGVTGPAAPNRQVANRFGEMQPAYSLRGAHAEEAAGNNDAKYSQTVVGNATNARNANYTLDAIGRDAALLPVGRGMTQVAEGRAWLQSVYDNVPGAKEIMKDPGQDATAAYDSLVKNSGQLTRQALVQTGERAAMAYDMIQKQLPNIETSRGGMQRVVAEWQGLNDDALTKQQVMAKTPMAGRSDAFEAEWNKNVNPVAFMLQRMSPDDRKHVMEGLKKTPGGQQVLQDVQTTLNYLASKGIR